MEAIVIKSPKKFNKKKETKDQESKSSNIPSIIPVSLWNKINGKKENLCDDKFEISIKPRSECVSSADIINASKDSDNVLSNSTVPEDDGTIKSPRTRVTCKKELLKNNLDQEKTGNNLLVKNMPRKVLAEKQIRTSRYCNKPTVILRSSRRRESNVLGKCLSDSSVTQASNEDKIGTKICKDEATVTRKSITVKKNDSEGSDENSEPLDVGNRINSADAKFQTKNVVTVRSLSLVKKIMTGEHEKLRSMRDPIETVQQTNKNNDTSKEKENLINDSMKNIDVSPKKKFHRRKCSEPMKTKGIQTRQSRSNTSLENKNSCEQSSSLQKTVQDEEPKDIIQQDECTIICTPDINLNDEIEDKSSSDDQNVATSSSRNQNIELRNDEDFKLSDIKTEESNLSSTDSTEPESMPIETTCSKDEGMYSDSFEKAGEKNIDRSIEQKLRHITAQAMPVFKSKIAVAKNDNGNKSSVNNKSVRLSRMSKTDVLDEIEETEEFNDTLVEEPLNVPNNVSICSKADKNSAPKISHSPNDDSEETLSNVESVPNSPAKDIWSKVTEQNLKFSNKVVDPKMSSVVNVSVTQKTQNSILGPATETNSRTNFSRKKNVSGSRYYSESSENQQPSNIFDGSEKNIEDENPGGSQETPWLRHYERPPKSNASTSKNFAAESDDSEKENSSLKNQRSLYQQRKYVEATRKTGRPPSNNLTSTEERKAKKHGGQFLEPLINPTFKKRGRPRKQDNVDSDMNAKKRRTSPASTEERRKKPARNEPAHYCSGLTKLESDILFCKFSQHGNFMYTSDQPPIIIYDGELYQKIHTRMQRRDPRKYYTCSRDVNTQADNSANKMPSFSQQNIPSDNDYNKRYTPNNSSSNEFTRKLRMVNQNSRNFSNQLLGQVEYCGSSSTQTNISSGNNRVPNYMQSGYNATPDYHQNFSNNNTHSMGNTSHFNNYPVLTNSNNFINNMNAATGTTNLSSNLNSSDNNCNFTTNSQNQYRNFSPYREIDLTMNNVNNMSSNSIDCVQRSPANWNLNNVNQSLDSMNGIIMDSNSMNHGNGAGQSLNGSSDLNNVTNNSDSTMNVSNSWADRSENMTNTRFPVPPWHQSVPTYLNNGNPYYNNMFNPYASMMGFDVSNYSFTNRNGKSCTEAHNTNPWMQSNNFSASNSEFTNLNSSASNRNITTNQGINLSLSSNAVIDNTVSQTNFMGVNNANLDFELVDEMNPEIEESEGNNFLQSGNNNVGNSAQDYGNELSLPCSMEYKNNTENMDFEVGNTDDSNLQKEAEEILPDIRDYVTQRLDSFEECFSHNYKQNGSQDSENVPVQINNRETEITKLRQELADFTRQYSDDQSSATSQL